MCEGETTPPPLLQEADLIALMEKHGIGTDATHAEHIETIKSRNYVGVQSDGGFVPGELGMGLVEGYDSMGYELSKPMLRAELEADLKRICEGVKSKEEVLSLTLDKYKEVFVNATQQAPKLEEALSKYFGPPQAVAEEEEAPPILSETVRQCPLCQQCNLVVKRKRDGGFMLSCIGYPDCRAVQYFPAYVTDAVPHESMCTRCQPQPVHKLKLTFKPGSVPPYVGSEHIGCTTCDHTLKEELGFMPIRSSTGSSTGNTSRSQSQHGTQRNQGNTRTGTNSSQTRSTRGGTSQSGSGRGSTGSAGGSSSYPPHRNGSSNWNDQDFGGQFPPGSGASLHQFGSEASNGSDNVPVCICGEVAQLLTVRREDSANKGRQFYKCSQRDGGCDFFLWADQAPSGSTGSTSTAAGGHYGSSSLSSTTRQPSLLSVSRTRGRGRARGGNTNTRGTGSYRGSRNNNDNSGMGFEPLSRGASHSDDGSGQTIMCNCGIEAVQRTVQKSGPNKGKQFFTCSKPREEQCGFFEWADNVPSCYVRQTPGGGGTSGTRGRGRGRGMGGAEGRSTESQGFGAGDGSTGRKRAPPTCSVCRQQGHTKRSCPQAKQLS